MTEQPKNKRSKLDSEHMTQVAMGASLAVAVLMLVGKSTAYWITGSTAILSDAAESVIHLAATGLASLSLWYSRRPADANHPYGHGKIAYFSAGFEGALILIASLAVIGVGVNGLINGVELRQLDLGILITAALGFVNLLLGLLLVRTGKKNNQLILVSNGKHVLTDMWTSLGVVIGILLVYITDILWLDPLMAVLAGVNILWSALQLMRNAVRGLLDEVSVADTEALLNCLSEAVGQGTISGFHQLRHRATDSVMWIEVHVQLPDSMDNLTAHDRATDVEERITHLFPEYTVHMTTHIEPESHEMAHPAGHDGVIDPLSADSGTDVNTA